MKRFRNVKTKNDTPQRVGGATQTTEDTVDLFSTINAEELEKRVSFRRRRREAWRGQASGCRPSHC